MAAGLRCWDAQGRLILDFTDRITQHIGTTPVPAGSSGSVLVPATGANNLPYAVFEANDPGNDPLVQYPNITLSGDTVYWDYAVSGNVTPNRVGGVIKYGRY